MCLSLRAAALSLAIWRRAHGERAGIAPVGPRVDQRSAEPQRVLIEQFEVRLGGRSVQLEFGDVPRVGRVTRLARNHRARLQQRRLTLGQGDDDAIAGHPGLLIDEKLLIVAQRVALQ